MGTHGPERAFQLLESRHGAWPGKCQTLFLYGEAKPTLMRGFIFLLYKGKKAHNIVFWL